ncbi:MAG: AAA family ATPase, partial [Acidobacteria bacterium]|nr:AAA family ATPase [Acidobacteriota bacterium]
MSASTTPPAISLPPRYELRSALSSTVLAVFDREAGERAVFKLAAGATEEDLLQLRREFRLLAALDHPSIVKARDFGVLPSGVAFFTMDEVPGPDLATFAKGHALLENLSALVDVAHALDYVHARGLVHGDVKPTNVRVSGERAFLLDFGLAIQRGEEAEGIRGTPSYVAPEVLRGARPDRRADLYSLGMTFYEALTGVLPTSGRDLAGVLRFHLEEDVPVASRVAPAIPGKLDRILAHLLEKEPGMRYPSARRLLEELGLEFGLVRGATVDARPELLTPPFTGRADLLSRFSQALREAKEGLGRTILVTGAEGSGKSRLLAEWRALAQLEGALVVEGRARAEDETPYRPILDVLSAMTRRGGSAGAGARAALARAARLAATQVEDLPISRLTDERSRLALFEDVLNAFEGTRAAENETRPLVVLLDDVHFADRATQQLLAYLAKAVETHRIVLAGTAATQATAAEEDEDIPTVGAPPGPLSDFSPRPWPLAPLTELETAAAIGGALGEGEVPPDLSKTLHLESQGLPGPLTRILSSWVEARVLVLSEGHVTVDEVRRRKLLAQGTAAERLEGTLKSISPSARELLGRLSVIPTDLSFELARRLASPEAEGAVHTGDHMDSVSEALTLLTAAGLLVLRDRGGEAEYEFVSPRTRELVAATLAEDEKRRLHDIAAAYFESRLGARPDFISPAATHALRGSDPDRGIRLGLAAAAQAERLFAYDPAAAFYAGVLEFLDILGHDAEKSLVRERLGDVHFRAGNWRRALSAYHFLLKELGARTAAAPGRDAEARRRAALL